MPERTRPAALRGLEPWMLVLALLSLATSGVAPMLIPLEIVEIEGKALHVGLVMAAVGGGLLTAPLWSRMAARPQRHRPLVVGGALAIAASVGGFTVAREVHEWAALAFLMGAGTAAAFTTTSVLVNDRYPAADQHALTGWMQTLTTVGTMIGLVLAGGVSHGGFEPRVGFAIAAGLCLLAAPAAIGLMPAAAAAPGDPAPGAPAPASPAPNGPRGGAAAAEGPAGRRASLPFWSLLALWAVAGIGFNAVGALYPLLMREEFRVAPAASSYFLAVTSALSALLFVPASALSARRGDLWLLRTGLGLRLGSLALLSWMAVTPALERAWLAFLPYGVLALCWPLLSISGGMLVTRLAAPGGSGVGLFSAAGALASLAGPVVGGHAADSFGYASVWVLAAAGVVVALLLSLALAPRRATTASSHRPAAPSAGVA
jgi:MFS family permease